MIKYGISESGVKDFLKLATRQKQFFTEAATKYAEENNQDKAKETRLYFAGYAAAACVAVEALTEIINELQDYLPKEANND